MQIFVTQLENYIQNTVDTWNSITDADIRNYMVDRSLANTVISSGNYTYSNWIYNSGDISNLLTTKWNQREPYNNAIVSIKGANYPAGCGTIALAQILANKEFPVKCKTSAYNELLTNWTVAKNWNGIYDWNLIKSSAYGNNLSTEGKMQLQALIYDIATGISTNFKTSGTSSNTTTVQNYLNSIGCPFTSLTSYSYSTVKASISNDCPLYMSGMSTKETITTTHTFLWWSWTTTSVSYKGHAWIIDGYCNLTCTAKSKINSSDIQTITSDYVHCNLGWGGAKNGYYLSGLFDARNTTAPATDSQISSNRTTSPEGEAFYYQWKLNLIPNIGK